MNIKTIGYYMGNIIRLTGVLMAPALLIALHNGEREAALAFTLTIVAVMLVGLALLMCKRPSAGATRSREGYVTVALGWVVISLFGALPFYLSRFIPSFIDAWFETVSGFTTTGSTILANVEVLPRSLLYWRSFTHWIGGMGVLVFLLAIIPATKGNGESIHLLKAESPGPSVGKLTPTMRHTARILYIIYIVLTVVLIILLLAGGMPFFDSVVHAFGTAGTGGFSIKNLSIGAYDSHYLQTVIGIFMFVFGVNFNLYYLVVFGKGIHAFKNEEFKAYLGIVIAATALVAVNILPQYPSFSEAVHHGFFQVSSIITTTGYSTVDFNTWPEFSRILLLVLMVIGASAGSTGGGMKVARVVLMFKSLRNEAKKILRPREVSVITMDGKQVDGFVIRGVYAYLVAFVVIFACSVLLVALDNNDMETTVSAVFACMGNIGPGLSIVGPMGNFGSLSALSKLVLSLDMLFGRLEIFPLLVLFSPKAWRDNM